ncbi:hypothetical protein [Reichenbachiella sp.]|uniref:hypothetical protein n=1 Tax=Reichenbachiella sp. TaxID=2184521 RepID=UPI00329998E2
MKVSSILLPIFIVTVFSNCSKDDEPKTTQTKWRGTWSNGWPSLFHDGEPYEGENFVVYSDKSSQAWRKEVSEKAEESLTDIMTRFNLVNEDFDFVPLQSDGKIDILTNYDQWNRAVAYRDGIIIRSKDGPNFFGDHQMWQYVFQHEITHVIEFLLIGTPNRSNSSSVWMREGFGNYGARNHRIQAVEELEAWQEKMKDVPGEGNPIGIVVWSDFPESVTDANTTTEYYGFFELGVRYLLDEENGNGTNIDNLKAYFEDLGEGVSYRNAFKKHFNLDSDEFRDNYWTIMTNYLTESE